MTLEGRHLARFISILLAVAISGVVGSSVSAPTMAASVPPNDFFAFANVVTSLSYSDPGVNTALASTEPSEPPPSCFFGGPVAKTIWYKVVASATTTISVGVTPTNVVGNKFEPFIAAYRGTDVSVLTEVGCVQAPGVNTAQHLAFPITSGQTYYIQVGGHQGGFGGNEYGIFSFSLSGPRSLVTLHASSTSVRRGSSVTLSGSVRPSHPGATVTIQRKLNGTWRTFAKVRLSSTSTYRYVMIAKVVGTFVLRAFIGAQTNPSVLGGTSASRTIKVR